MAIGPTECPSRGRLADGSDSPVHNDKNDTVSEDHRQEVLMATPAIKSFTKDLVAVHANTVTSKPIKLTRRSDLRSRIVIGLAELSGKFAVRLQRYDLRAPFSLHRRRNRRANRLDRAAHRIGV
jgi:hypothetical protein